MDMAAEKFQQKLEEKQRVRDVTQEVKKGISFLSSV